VLAISFVSSPATDDLLSAQVEAAACALVMFSQVSQECIESCNALLEQRRDTERLKLPSLQLLLVLMLR
jgi:hypothetical protein